eukprot:CCRYP_006182-RA/>CCRYP_006182-RA protein AED:0.37 eAED:0.37 QI:0/0/0/1/0/0/2/0/187
MPSEHKNWMTFTKCWCHYTMQEESAIYTSAHQEEMNLVFANRSKEEVIYPLTVREIHQAQKLDASLKMLKDHYLTQLVESTEILCKDGKVVIPEELQHLAVSWYHHYLQHPGHTRLEETLCAAMYWKDKFITKAAAWTIHSTYHTVIKASPGAAIFGQDMLFNIPFLANWNKIEEYWQHQTDQNTER